MTASLRQVLPELRSRILRYRDSRINEEATKTALIQPMLRALGWNVEDIDEVHPEYRRRSSDNPVDYALMVLREPRLFVEAKALGEDLGDPRWANQFISYAMAAGVKWILLTNGDEYRVYNAYAEAPVEQKIFRTVRISDENSRTIETLELLVKERLERNELELLWRAQFVDHKVKGAIERLFSPDGDQWLVNAIRRQVPDLTPSDIRSSLRRMRLQLDFPDEPGLPPAGPHPTPAPQFTVIAGPSGDAKSIGHEKKELAEREVLRLKFWKELLSRAKNAGVTTHANVHATKDHWISAGAGRSGFAFTYLIWTREDQAGVELYIDMPDKERNKRAFDCMQTHRSAIEDDFGSALDWQRLDDGRASRIRFHTGMGGLRDESRWPAIQESMISAMDRFSKAFQPFIPQLPG